MSSVPFVVQVSRRKIPGSRSLVTGASGGIGRAIALELARQGSRVVLFARREDRLRALADEIRSAGGQAEYLAGDVTEPAARRAALALARERFGGLDILVNNAGIGALGRFEWADSERLRKIFEVNFFAAAELIRESLPLLKQATRPIVVNVSSVLGHLGIPRCSEYCASKFALLGLSESLRAEFAPLAIDLLVVSPGTNQSDFFDNVIERRGERTLAEQPAVPAEKVARATVRAIRRGRREIIPNTRGWLVCWLKRLAPWMIDPVLARFG